MKNKKNNLKRRDVLIGASVLTGAALLSSCDDKVDGGTPDEPKESAAISKNIISWRMACLLYTSPSPRDGLLSRMPSSA